MNNHARRNAGALARMGSSASPQRPSGKSVVITSDGDEGQQAGQQQRNRAQSSLHFELDEENAPFHKAPPESYEDVEGMLTNIGIVSALMLGICVGTFSMVTPESMDFADFDECAKNSAAFREVVLRSIRELVAAEAESMQEFPKNFEMDYGPNNTVNLNTSDWGPKGMYNTSEVPCEPDNCAMAEGTGAEIHIFRHFFPMPRMRSWQRTDAGDMSCPTNKNPSDVILHHGVFSMTFLSVSVFGSLFAYSSLAYSDARETILDEHGGGELLRRWRRLGDPMTISLIICMVLGTMFWFLMFNTVCVAIFPFLQEGKQLAVDYGTYRVLLPGTLISFFISGLAMHQGTQKSRARRFCKDWLCRKVGWLGCTERRRKNAYGKICPRCCLRYWCSPVGAHAAARPPSAARGSASS